MWVFLKSQSSELQSIIWIGVDVERYTIVKHYNYSTVCRFLPALAIFTIPAAATADVWRKCDGASVPIQFASHTNTRLTLHV